MVWFNQYSEKQIRRFVERIEGDVHNINNYVLLSLVNSVGYVRGAIKRLSVALKSKYSGRKVTFYDVRHEIYHLYMSRIGRVEKWDERLKSPPTTTYCSHHLQLELSERMWKVICDLIWGMKSENGDISSKHTKCLVLHDSMRLVQLEFLGPIEVTKLIFKYIMLTRGLVRLFSATGVNFNLMCRILLIIPSFNMADAKDCEKMLQELSEEKEPMSELKLHFHPRGSGSYFVCAENLHRVFFKNLWRHCGEREVHDGIPLDNTMKGSVHWNREEYEPQSPSYSPTSPSPKRFKLY